jgi:hypothetical protein
MKGIQGLVIAVVLGILGAVVNMVYLSKGRNTEVVTFIGVKPGAKIELGKPIRADDLEPIAIPSANVGNLNKFAFVIEPGKKISDAKTILGWKAARELNGGELILRDDLRTPPPHLALKEGESVQWITINTSTAVVSQLIPGETRISFYLPKNRGHTVGQPPSETGVNTWEFVGPFEFLAVGTRMGDPEVMSANRVSTKQQNVVTLLVNNENEDRVMDVYNYWHSTNYEPLAVKMHPAPKSIR